MEILQSLGINEGFFWMLGIYLGSFTLVYFIGLKDLSAAVIERANRINGRAEKAVHLKFELSKTLESLAQHMKRARSEAQEVFLSLRAKAAKEQKVILAEAREKSAAEIKQVRQGVAEKTAAELKKLEQDIPAIARFIIDQIIKGGKSAVKSQSTELRS